MALTPTVADAAVIQTSWGNEIRNRTCQVFATAAERNAWAAPNGAIAVTLDTNRLALRANGIWVPFSACLANGVTGTTNQMGDLIVTHGLGIVPRSVVVTRHYVPTEPFGWFLWISSTTTTFTVRAMNYNGLIQTNTAVGCNWVAAV